VRALRRPISVRQVTAKLRPRLLGTGAIRSQLAARRATAAPPVLATVSPQLRAFTEQLPLERRSILEFVAGNARGLAPGTRVLDAGAGEAPYRELFAHCDYKTTDWTQSVHPGAQRADVVASLDELPLPDASFDVVVCTQVLEHVDDPPAVVGELHRVLRLDGRLWMTVPLTWPLHEEPFDFFRYTPYSLEAMLGRAGFIDIDVAPRNGYFTTVAQLLRIAGEAVGWPDDGRNGTRGRLFGDLRRLASQLERYDHLDSRRILPLGYQVTARRAGDSA
jgi:SAM-dependent methyltransferase